jgi:hypothetical protein
MTTGAMRRRRRGRIVFAAIAAALVAVGVAAWAGKLPILAHAWQGIAATAASSSVLLPGAVSGDDAGAVAAAGPQDGGGDAAPVYRHQRTSLSKAQLGAPLVHGTFVSACGAPDNMKIVVKVAVKMGRAVSILVKSTPPDPNVEACVERAVGEMRWDISPKTDHVTVTY